MPDRLLAGGAIRFEASNYLFAPARPVTMEFVVLFPACRRTDGQWPPLRVGDLKLICHLENGNVPTTSAGYNRDIAITTSTI